MQAEDECTDLTSRAAKGDPAACRDLIRLHQRQLASTIYGILGACTEAEDIGQEAFMRFFASLSQFRGDASTATYLTRIAVNLCINEIRKRQRQRLFHRIISPEQLDRIHDTVPLPSASIEQITVHKALQRLKPKYRTVLVLRHMNGCSTAETAAILSLPIGTVLSRLSRAQEQLRKILDPAGKEKNHVKTKKAQAIA